MHKMTALFSMLGYLPALATLLAPSASLAAPEALYLLPSGPTPEKVQKYIHGVCRAIATRNGFGDRYRSVFVGATNILKSTTASTAYDPAFDEQIDPGFNQAREDLQLLPSVESDLAFCWRSEMSKTSSRSRAADEHDSRSKFIIFKWVGESADSDYLQVYYLVREGARTRVLASKYVEAHPTDLDGSSMQIILQLTADTDMLHQTTAVSVSVAPNSACERVYGAPCVYLGGEALLTISISDGTGVKYSDIDVGNIYIRCSTISASTTTTTDALSRLARSEKESDVSACGKISMIDDSTTTTGSLAKQRRLKYKIQSIATVFVHTVAVTMVSSGFESGAELGTIDTPYVVLPRSVLVSSGDLAPIRDITIYEYTRRVVPFVHHARLRGVDSLTDVTVLSGKMAIAMGHVAQETIAELDISKSKIDTSIEPKLFLDLVEQSVNWPLLFSSSGLYSDDSWLPSSDDDMLREIIRIGTEDTELDESFKPTRVLACTSIYDNLRAAAPDPSSFGLTIWRAFCAHRFRKLVQGFSAFTRNPSSVTIVGWNGQKMDYKTWLDQIRNADGVSQRVYVDTSSSASVEPTQIFDLHVRRRHSVKGRAELSYSLDVPNSIHAAEFTMSAPVLFDTLEFAFRANINKYFNATKGQYVDPIVFHPYELSASVSLLDLAHVGIGYWLQHSIVDTVYEGMWPHKPYLLVGFGFAPFAADDFFEVAAGLELGIVSDTDRDYIYSTVRVGFRATHYIDGLESTRLSIGVAFGG